MGCYLGGNKAYVLFFLLAYEMRVIPPRFFSILLPGGLLQLLLLSIASAFFFFFFCQKVMQLCGQLCMHVLHMSPWLL